jgi:hypothetical protein
MGPRNRSRGSLIAWPENVDADVVVVHGAADAQRRGGGCCWTCSKQLRLQRDASDEHERDVRNDRPALTFE